MGIYAESFAALKVNENPKSQTLNPKPYHAGQALCRPGAPKADFRPGTDKGSLVCRLCIKVGVQEGVASAPQG